MTALTRQAPKVTTILLIVAGFAVLDIAEVVHQLDEYRIGLGVLAGVIATLHVAAATLARHQTATARQAAPS